MRTAIWCATSHAARRKRRCVDACTIWRPNGDDLAIVACSFLLRREGETSDKNRIYRLYREEGLMVRWRRARRRAIGTRAPILVEAKVNARGSLDFVQDQFAGGRRFRILNVVDDVTRETQFGKANVRRRFPTRRSPASALHAN